MDGQRKMKSEKSRKENLKDLVDILAKHNAPSLLVLEIARVIKNMYGDFKIVDFRNEIDSLRPNDHDHGSGGKPFEKACIPAVKEFVRFWTDDMQREYNVMDFHTWDVMMDQLELEIKALAEKRAVFDAEVAESVARRKKEEEAEREYAREHWGCR